MEWKATGRGNIIAHPTDDVLISFNPGGGLVDVLSIFAQDENSDGETAIRKRGPNGERGVYLILNGDHRAAYEAASADGWDAMVAYYESKKGAHRSSWSEDAESETVDA